MPAKSRSQQRLFGMVHAFNKGELHGSKSLMRRISGISRHISDTDAKHFAKTPHDGLPEKKAQMYISPEQVREMYSRIPEGMYTPDDGDRSRKRRSMLDSTIRGAALGSLAGGIGVGALGAFLGHRAASDTPGITTPALLARMGLAGLKCGWWGATRGAALGSVAGAGLNIMGRLRS